MHVAWNPSLNSRCGLLLQIVRVAGLRVAAQRRSKTVQPRQFLRTTTAGMTPKVSTNVGLCHQSWRRLRHTIGFTEEGILAYTRENKRKSLRRDKEVVSCLDAYTASTRSRSREFFSRKTVKPKYVSSCSSALQPDLFF